MKMVVADTGALISLAIAGQIDIIEKALGTLILAGAVLEELRTYDNPLFDKALVPELERHVKVIKSKNHLSFIMDYGESESVILYDELGADFLLIDDNKARTIAESLGVNCIGSIGLLVKAKQMNLIQGLRPIFEIWYNNQRYFSKGLLNRILLKMNEDVMK